MNPVIYGETSPGVSPGIFFRKKKLGKTKTTAPKASLEGQQSFLQRKTSAFDVIQKVKKNSKCLYMSFYLL